MAKGDFPWLLCPTVLPLIREKGCIITFWDIDHPYSLRPRPVWLYKSSSRLKCKLHCLRPLGLLWVPIRQRRWGASCIWPCCPPHHRSEVFHMTLLLAASPRTSRNNYRLAGWWIHAQFPLPAENLKGIIIENQEISLRFWNHLLSPLKSDGWVLYS